ncbi:hypothetical protein PHLGIDRAFT_338072 [Phlebiopsis gigantea 11061_1 CR5-6]|uniref:DUF6534 domain-containing protein n=1 Tax=Phlebiopsis gigantea (strain 11061_1 CR5-6) TaxID=745531 RepID=A0A0C3PQA2_PHLG1|nr:hypothetical protein PHLGIDRAFT_338072 [Phlebiopsis gigantea 11061_1 CR5-6]
MITERVPGRCTSVLAVLVVMTFVLTMELGIRMFFLNTFLTFSELNWNLYLNLSLDIASSISIAFAICYYLLRLRSTAVRSTQSLVKNLMVYTVNTGLLTSFISIISLATRLTQPDNLVFLAVLLPLCGLYANALLASLNARDWHRSPKEVISISVASTDTSGAAGNVVGSRSLPAMTFARQDRVVSPSGPLHLDLGTTFEEPKIAKAYERLVPMA